MKASIGIKEFTRAIHTTLGGHFKVYWWGHSDDYISGWNGAGYKFTPIDGQPRNGYDTLEEARTFRDIEREQPNLRRVNGSSIPEIRFVE